MTKINYKSLLIGIIHSVIIPLLLVYVSKNLFIGLAYYLIPITAYETFVSQREESKSSVLHHFYLHFFSVIDSNGRYVMYYEYETDPRELLAELMEEESK